MSFLDKARPVQSAGQTSTVSFASKVRPVQQVEPVEPKQSLGSKILGVGKAIGNAITSSEQTLGKALGTAVAASGVNKQQEEETAQNTELQNQIQVRLKNPLVSRDQKLKLLKLSQELGLDQTTGNENFDLPRQSSYYRWVFCTLTLWK